MVRFHDHQIGCHDVRHWNLGFFQGITESEWEAPVGYSSSSNWILLIPQGSQGWDRGMYGEGGKKKGHIWGPTLQSEQLFWPILKYSATVYDFIDQQNCALKNKIKKLLNLKTTGVVQFKWRDWDLQWIQSHQPGGNRPGVTSTVFVWL